MGVVASIVVIAICAIGLIVLVSTALARRARRAAHREIRPASWDPPPSEIARYDQAPYLHTRGRDTDPRR